MSTTNILDLNNRIDELEKNVDELEEKIGYVRMTKLWENSSPTAAFAAQNITLSSSDYDFLIILYNWTKDTSISYSTLVQKNNKFELAAIAATTGGTVTASRLGSYNSTTVVHFGDCLYSTASSGTTDNDRCIPIIIYSIKLT